MHRNKSLSLLNGSKNPLIIDEKHLIIDSIPLSSHFCNFIKMKEVKKK